MSVDEWCPESGRYASHQTPESRGVRFRFDRCPTCQRRLRLTWNGRFYRHKRRLAERGVAG